MGTEIMVIISWTGDQNQLFICFQEPSLEEEGEEPWAEGASPDDVTSSNSPDISPHKKN